MTTEQTRAPQTRRPLPALIFIAALVVLAGVVWLRLLHTGSDKHHHSAALPPCPSVSPTPSPTPSLPALKVLPLPHEIHVLVLNSTDRSGLAATTAHRLDKDGFTIAKVDNDTKKYGGHGLIAGVAEIRYGTAARAEAALLSYYLPGATLVPSDSNATTVTVALGQQYHSLVGTKQVHRQLKAAGVKLHKIKIAAPHGAASTSAAHSPKPSPSTSPTCSPAHS